MVLPLGMGREDAEDTVQQVFGSVRRNGSASSGTTGRGIRSAAGSALSPETRSASVSAKRAISRRPPAAPRRKVRFQELPDENAKDADSSDAQDASELFRRGLELIRSEFKTAPGRRSGCSSSKIDRRTTCAASSA